MTKNKKYKRRKRMNNLGNYEINLKEFVGSVVDQLEDFLDAHGIKIDNEDRDVQDPCAAIIYGEDYGYFEDIIITGLKKYHYFELTYDEAKHEATEIVFSLLDLLMQKGHVPDTGYDFNKLIRSVESTYEQYGFVSKLREEYAKLDDKFIRYIYEHKKMETIKQDVLSLIDKDFEKFPKIKTRQRIAEKCAMDYVIGHEYDPDKSYWENLEILKRENEEFFLNHPEYE